MAADLWGKRQRLAAASLWSEIQRLTVAFK